ncbi:FlgB family protein [Flavimaricola marinus]|uniref:Flagellar basal body rod protein FlgB n=1 Tax=Flavimaricola marinus TaxID=1819565 RepID=A0A238LEU9_9RHOB|nr:FlgB family protein [Flavimaricola marinus]SMY08237.1 Flagellar basal body rod protein FlgB [Flavimaricola marinus]
MYKNLDLFQVSSQMARHAGSRQAIVATNIANADTPGYQARAIASFTDSYSAAETGRMRATRPGHIGAANNSPAIARAETSGAEPSPNGNTVSIEQEMLNAVNIEREHSRALAIYKHALTVMRTSLGR